MGSPATKAKNKYNYKSYDRINLVVPKGDRELIQKFAECSGMSVNCLITRLLYREMGKKPPY